MAANHARSILDIMSRPERFSENSSLSWLLEVAPIVKRNRARRNRARSYNNEKSLQRHRHRFLALFLFALFLFALFLFALFLFALFLFALLLLALFLFVLFLFALFLFALFLL